jgi:hypothetical protein
MVPGDVSLACDVEQRGFRRCRLLRGKTQVGALRQVCTRRRRELTSPSTIGFPFSFGKKKKCPLGPESPRRDKRCLDGAGGPPREVPEASMREGESECTSGRGIRWCRAM